MAYSHRVDHARDRWLVGCRAGLLNCSVHLYAVLNRLDVCSRYLSVLPR